MGCLLHDRAPFTGHDVRAMVLWSRADGEPRGRDSARSQRRFRSPARRPYEISLRSIPTGSSWEGSSPIDSAHAVRGVPTWVLTDLKPEILERAGAAQI
jgi:hypothetical protein